jgi:PAS domain S-box-containing protein
MSDSDCEKRLTIRYLALPNLFKHLPANPPNADQAMNIPRAIQLPSRNSIQAQLMLLVLTLTLPMTALWAWYAWTETRDAERDSFNAVRYIVERTAAHIGNTLDDYETITINLAKEYDLDRQSWSPQFEPKQFLRLHPGVISIGVYPPTKKAQPATAGNQMPTDLRTYLAQTWNGTAQSPSTFTISGAVWEPDVLRWVTVLTYPVQNQQGSRTGIVYLTIDLLDLNKAMLGAAHSDVVIPVIDRDNHFLMRSTDPQEWIGEALPATNAALIEGKRNEDFSAVDLNQQRRLYAMKTLEKSGWRVFAGMRETAAIGTARNKAATSVGLGLLTLLLMLAAIWRNARAIARPIDELSRAVVVMRRDSEYRVKLEGPKEVVEVGQQLNQLLDRVATEQQERQALADHYASIVNNARDCIFLFDDKQRIVDFNQHVQDVYGYSASELHHMAVKDLRAPEAQDGIERDWRASSADQGVLFETVHRSKSGETLYVEISANRFEKNGTVYVQSFVRDISERKRVEMALARQTRALTALSACNHVLNSAENVESLLSQVCDILLKVGGYPLAWVGRPEHDEAKRVSVWAKSGAAADYLDTADIRWADEPRGRGPAGLALRERRTVIARNLATQTGFEPWRDEATARGIASCIAMPLLANGNPIALLVVYGAASDVFDSDEVKLLEELANNVANGIADFLTREQAVHLESELEASDQRFQMLIEQLPAGMYILRDRIFAYANPRMDEILGMPYGALVGQDVKDFVLADDWHILVEANERMDLLGTTGNLQVRCQRQDGVVIEIGLQNVASHFEGTPAVIGMAQDIGERNRAQTEIHNYILQLERTTEATLQAVSNMVEKRDPYTAGHERRVGELAGAIGAEMGLSAHDIKGLRLAGFVHDLGKIAVPAELLAKPTRLNEAEMALIRMHPQAGYDVLKDIEFPWPIAHVILQHHERMDGGGYPNHLKGPDIVLEARIMMVADVVESMSSHRPYRPGLGIEAALAEIEKNSGVHYDTQVVEACTRLFREKNYQIAD